MALHTTNYNVEHYQKKPEIPTLGTDAVKRALIHTEFHIKEFSGLTMKFLPKGHLNIKGSRQTPYDYEWSVFHSNDKVIMKISPQILQIHSDMVVELPNKNTVILTSIADNTEKLTLIRVNLKSY